MWEIEADYDYCQFQVSTDGGNSWIGQCGNYTVEGTDANGSVQPDGEPVFEGFQTDWVLEEISLSDYLGELIQVRFIIEADGGVREDGFYFDDFSISYDLDTSGASGLDELELQAKVVPNPANRLAYVSLPVVLSQGEMTIYDQAGHTVCERTISEQTNKIAIETGGLPQAVYFVHINDGDKVWKPIKLIVVH